MVLEGNRRKAKAGKRLMGGQGRAGVGQGAVVLGPLDRPFSSAFLKAKTISNFSYGLSSGSREWSARC